MSWLYIVVIANSAGGSKTDAESMIRMSMIAGAVATISPPTPESPRFLGSRSPNTRIVCESEARGTTSCRIQLQFNH